MTINIFSTVLLNLAILIGLFGFLTLVFKGISVVFSSYNNGDNQKIGAPNGSPAGEPI